MAFDWFGVAGMFQLGNSNSTATIDISGAYAGLGAFHRPLVAALVWLTLYSAPALHTAAALATPHARMGVRAAALGVGRHALAAAAFCAVCLALRHHLFVWSVVSPKLLYVAGGATLALAQAAALAAVAVAAQSGTRREQA